MLATDNCLTERFYLLWNRCNIRANDKASTEVVQSEVSKVYRLLG